MKSLLTPIEEDELLEKVRLRRTLSDKRLCELHSIGRRTLWDALERAEARERAEAGERTPETPPNALLRIISGLA
jgi:hypothetical protein